MTNKFELSIISAESKVFEGKAVGYEGQTFILTNKSGQLFQVPFNALSNADKAYLVEAVKAKIQDKLCPEK